MNKSYLKSLNHKLNKKIKNNRFLIGIYTQFVPVLKYFYFKNERLASKGKNISNSQHQSILYFTAQKCASTLLSGILEKLSLEENMVAIRYSNYLPDVDRSAEFRDESFLKRAFKKKGYYYGAFRSFHPVPNIEDYKVLLVLRDPRDVLTSSYFSTAFNHPIARKDTLEKRAIAKNQDIDTYVLENADFFKKAYQDYTQNILHLDNAIFLKYEDMIEDFEPWLNQLLSHVGLNKNKEAIAEIIRNTSFEVKSENKNNFIRNVKAGDHIRKLKPETIEKLNVIFKDILDKLGY